MKTHSILCGVVAILSIAGCKKEADQPPASETCRITSIVLSGAADAITNISYDGEGRISKLDRDSVSANFSYSGNTINILSVTANTLTRRTTIELNTQGLAQKITSVTIRDDGSAFDPRVETYEYNSAGEALKKIEQAGDNAPETTVFTWSNGNLVSESDGTTYEYFLDQPIRDGDGIRERDILGSGIIIFRNKNLVKRAVNNNSGVTQDLTYEFDSDGKIIRRNTLVNNDIAITRTMQYACE